MAEGFATVFYGVFVKTLHLIAAAKAWPSLEPTLLAVDLIALRRNTGKLEVETGAPHSITRLSAEAWNEIQRALVDVELTDAHNSISRDEWWCLECSTPPALGPDGVLSDCVRCSDYFYEGGSLNGIVEQQEKNLKSLLSRYGMHRPSDKLYNGDRPSLDDENSLTAIACPHPPTDYMTSSLEPGPANGVVGHAVHLFDPSLFTLRPDTASRFCTFAHLFRLPLYDPSRYFEPPQRNDEPKAAALADGPRWHFWASVDEFF
ncbi:hypothetical protein JCM10207_003745 [Rhodosporidiobolus poonsookiae]